VPERIEVDTRMELLLPKVRVFGRILHGRAGGLQAGVELVIGELDLVAEDDLGVVQLVGDDAGSGVLGEQAGVEVDQAAQGGEAELPGF
jgi:hypothetical protein